MLMTVGKNPKKTNLKIKQFIQWCKHHRLQLIIGIGVLCIATVGSVSFFLLSQPLPAPDKTPISIKPRPPKPKIYSPIDGSMIDTEADKTKPVTMIMLENSTDARPQSGLKDAQIVYEAIAEGGITRFLAVYQQTKPLLIGPVRSIRPYYLDWAAPYNGAIAHVGGSAEALQQVRNGTFRDIDQFFNANAYWRVSDRRAPHNVYTSFEMLDALQASKGYPSSAPKGMLRGDTQPASPASVTHVDVHISSRTYDSSYDYDSASNSFKRSQNGAPHTDREKGQISPRVVVVIKAPTATERQKDTWRTVINTIGSGNATIFQDGTAIEAIWTKTSREEQFTFSNTAGEPIALTRGQTWITVIPASSGSVSWK